MKVGLISQHKPKLAYHPTLTGCALSAFQHSKWSVFMKEKEDDSHDAKALCFMPNLFLFVVITTAN